MEKESNKKKSNNYTLLKVLLVILIIFLIGLTVYKFNVYDKKENDNNITENNKEEDKLVVLTVDLNGGKSGQQFSEKYKLEEGIILEEPTKEGYYFLRWQVDGGIINGNKLTLYRDTSLKAIWSETKPEEENIKYEIKKEGYKEYLYVNGIKIDKINSINFLINPKETVKNDNDILYIKEHKEVLLVAKSDAGNQINSELYLIDKKGTLIEYNDFYSQYSSSFLNIIKNIKVEENNVYISANRRKTDEENWYCYCEDKNEIAEYELKYEYSNGKLVNKDIKKEIKISEKYKNTVCPNTGTNSDNSIRYEIYYDNENPAGHYAKTLYVNGKEITGGFEIEVEAFKDILIVKSWWPGGAAGYNIYFAEKNGEATKLEYKISDYDDELWNAVESYKIENDNIYIKVKRQRGDGALNWYCWYKNKQEPVEYTIKYKYLGNSKFSNMEVVEEIPIAEKYKDEVCPNVGSNEDGSINYETIREKNGNEVLYVNNKKVDGIVTTQSYYNQIKIKEISDTLVVEVPINEGNIYYEVDKNGVAAQIEYKQ